MSLPWIFSAGAIAVIIVLLGIILAWRIIKDRRSGYPPQDERTQRITGKAATYAFFIGQYFTIALLLVNIISQEIFNLPAFEVGYALVALLLASSLSFLALRLYFDRKGDF